MPPAFDQSPTVICLMGVTALAAATSIVMQVSVARRDATAIAAVAGDRTWAWLRHSVLIACVGSFGVIMAHSEQGVPIHVPTMALFSTSTFVMTLHWIHVWFFAWPAARFGGERALTRASALLRWNVATSPPLLFFFYASIWRPDLGGAGRWIREDYWGPTILVYAALTLGTLCMPRLCGAVLRPWPIALAVGVALSLLVLLLR